MADLSRASDRRENGSQDKLAAVVVPHNMKPPTPQDLNQRQTPEKELSGRIIQMLSLRGWVVIKTHGNAAQKGFPDLYALHHTYGARWIEVKLPKGSVLTKAQLTTFPHFSSAGNRDSAGAVRSTGGGHGIWLMTKADIEEYKKLHLRENWQNYINTMSNRGRDASVLECYITGTNTEAKIQNAIMKRLRENGWVCLPTHGNMYQQGLPDVYALHPEHGGRWIEVKQSTGYRFTPAQKQYFPVISQAGHGIWVLTSETETERLHKPQNWTNYMYSPWSH